MRKLTLWVLLGLQLEGRLGTLKDASAIIMTKLFYEMEPRKVKYGLVLLY